MKTTKKIRLILADDHILLRDALANLINGFDEFQVIAKAGNGIEVQQSIKNGSRPDIILMDLNMPVADGYETAKWLKQNHPEIKVLILTMYDGEITLIRLLRTGVNGFLKKDIHPSQLKEALIAVAGGDYYYSNATTGKIASLFVNEEDKFSLTKKANLFEKEIEFLKLVSTELTYKEIAATMNLTPRNIDAQRDNLFEKLGVKSRVGLAIYAIKSGIVVF